jgi:hypothetical protein
MGGVEEATGAMLGAMVGAMVRPPHPPPSLNCRRRNHRDVGTIARVGAPNPKESSNPSPPPIASHLTLTTCAFRSAQWRA